MSNELKIDKDELESVKSGLTRLHRELMEHMESDDLYDVMCGYNMARAIMDLTRVLGKSKDYFLSFGSMLGAGLIQHSQGDFGRKHPLLDGSNDTEEEEGEHNLDAAINAFIREFKRNNK